jgi:hypothetical protein
MQREILKNVLQNIIPNDIFQNILVHYVSNIISSGICDEIEWERMNDYDIVCVDDTIYILDRQDIKEHIIPHNIFRIDIKDMIMTRSHIFFKQREHYFVQMNTKSVGLYSECFYGADFYGDNMYEHKIFAIDAENEIVSFLLGNKHLIDYGGFLLKKICMSYDGKSMISYFYNYMSNNSIIEKLYRSNNNKCQSPNTLIHQNKINHVLIFGSDTIIITDKWVYRYDDKLKRKHRIIIPNNKKILAACTNNTCLFLLQLITEKKKHKDDETYTKISVCIYNSINFNKRDLSLNKPDEILVIGHTSCTIPELGTENDIYYMSASDKYLVVIDFDHLLNFFELYNDQNLSMVDSR